MSATGRPWITIVGVVSDIRREGKAGEIEPYLTATQTELYPVRLADFAVRTTADPSSLVKPLHSPRPLTAPCRHEDSRPCS